MAQGVLSVMQGGDFLSGSVSATLGSLGVSGFGAVAGEFSKSAGGVVIAGAISGGIGAELSGGNFWQGAVTGGIVAGLNSAMHRLGEDPSKRKQKRIVSKKSSSSLRGSRGGAIAVIDKIGNGPRAGQGPGTFVPSALDSEVSLGMYFLDNNKVSVDMVVTVDRINTSGTYVGNYSVEFSGKIIESGYLYDKGLKIGARMDFPVITRQGVNVLSTVRLSVPKNSIIKVNIGLINGKNPAGGPSAISNIHSITIN